IASLANGTSLRAGRSTATSTPRRAASTRARSTWRLGRKYPCASWMDVRAPRLSDPLAAQLAREPRAGVAPDLGGEVGPADGATVDAVLVADVDATHERYALVDEEELAMIARERAEQEPPAPGVNADRAAGGGQLRLDLARVLRRAPPVERDAHVDAAGSGGRQRRDEAPTRRVEAEEIHLQPHGLSRLLDGQDHARKCLDTAVEQRQILRGLHRPPHDVVYPDLAVRARSDAGGTRTKGPPARCRVEASYTSSFAIPTTGEAHATDGVFDSRSRRSSR